MSIPREILIDYLLHADERAVHHAYPRHLADELNADYRGLLEALVEAMFNGDAVLHWDVQCPGCGAHDRFASSLEDAPQGEVTCTACQAVFLPHLDDEIQVTFSPHPNRRRLGPGADDPAYRARMASTVAPTTGLEMLTVQSFRDWARQQPLPHGSSLEVRRVALMFTDLSGSTAMYQRSGDPRAFQLVREHFATLFAVVNRAGGAVVKTIGDAIMASFVGAADAMHAALSAHAAMDALNRRFTLQGDNRLLLKVGIHCGPSIVVTLNEQLDYFGQTVNLAARIQDASLGGHITFSQAVFDEPGMFDMVGSYPVEALKVRIKGFEEPIVVNRFQVLRET